MIGTCCGASLSAFPRHLPNGLYGPSFLAEVKHFLGETERHSLGADTFRFTERARTLQVGSEGACGLLRIVAALDLQFRASELAFGSLTLPSAPSASLDRDFSR